jgi:hypothetical protein
MPLRGRISPVKVRAWIPFYIPSSEHYLSPGSLWKVKWLPDEAHFDDRVLLASYGSITIRIAEDKDDIMLHLIPRRVFREGASEDAWYAWDIVTKALNLKARTAAEILEIVPDAHLQYLFSPMEWKEHTLPALRRTKRDRRARSV